MGSPAWQSPWAAVAAAVLVMSAPSSRAVRAGEGAPTSQDFAGIERGRYLTRLGDCAACHTDPNQGAPFAGGRPIETPFGKVLASNITPDPDTGIGDWSDTQFEDAVRFGTMPNGKRLYPAMPFPYYTRMTRADVLAIRAYLRTVEPVHNEVESNQLPFPFNIRAAMRLWDALYFSPGTLQKAPGKSVEWNRGAYIVEGPGHCGACHTPKTILGGDEGSHKFAGYSIQGWFAPNITNDDQRGLGRWSAADVVSYLKSGHNRFTGAAGPMGEEVAQSSSEMTDSDLEAITAYLKDQSSAAGREARQRAATEPVMIAGSAIYHDLCSACHAPDGKGVPYLFPDLADSSLLASREPTSLLRVVLRGARSVATRNEPTSPAMPGFGWQLTDEQVAAVTTYIRNSWTHSASAVSANDVRRARETLAASND